MKLKKIRETFRREMIRPFIYATFTRFVLALTIALHPHKKPSRMYGDIADYLDEQPVVTFEELEDEEKDVCLLCADVICCVLCLIASLFV